MKTKFTLILFISLLVNVSCTESEDTSKGEETFAKTREFADLWFHYSAEMEAIYIQTYKLAQLKLEKHLKDYKFDKKPAVVLDLDETVLDNSPYQLQLINNDKVYTSKNWTEWVEKSEAEALPGAADFINYTTEHKVEVFYISNRSIKHLSATIENLNKIGLPNADSEHVLLKEETGDKTPRRQKVAVKYEVLLYIGDNLIDFSQEFADRNERTMGKDLVEKNKHLFGEKYIILPNPMYGEWEKAMYKNTYKWSEKQKDSLRAVLLKAEGY